MFTNFYKSLLLSALAVIALVASSTDVWSQTFTMPAGATYNATCGAVIKLKAPTGSIVNTGNLIGTDAANAIPGVVEWAATSGTQNVQAFFYQSLVFSGAATKLVPTDVHILGTACPGYLSGYANLNIYPFYVDPSSTTNTYAGTLHYDGALPQTIFPQTNFVNLDLTAAGAKSILATDAVTLTGDITSSATTPLNVAGTLNLGTAASTLAGTLTLDNPATGPGAVLNIGTGALALNGNVTVTNGTIIAATGDGTVTVGTGAALALTNSSSKLDFGPTTNLVITGTATNTGDGTNLLFDCASTVTYNGAAGQVVMPTLSAHAYGSLVLSTGSKVGGIGYGNDIYICKDFTLNGGGNFDLLTNTDSLFMQAATGVVTYAANEEVVGSMTRVTDLTARAYTFNNAQTIITLAAAASNPTSMELDVRPSVNPNNWSATADVNRKINLAYAGNSAEFTFQARAGYLLSEGPGAWAAPYTQNSIRFYEAETAKQEKVGTGSVYAKTAAVGTTLGYVELAGIKSITATPLDNGIGYFASKNDLKLTAGPTTFYTVNDGRWTNPNTWDEGTLPSAIDNAEIRHMVYAGIAGPFAGTLAAGNTTPEATAYPGNIAAANTIVIASGYTNASLTMGNEDNGDTYKFWTAATSGTTFTNNNSNAASASFPINSDKSLVAKTGLNGLWITPYGKTSTRSTVFSTNSILNVGSVNNEGIIELGQ